MALSPDGQRLAFVASVNEPVRSYSQPDLWTLTLTANARPRNLTASFDYDVADGVGGDNAPPRGGRCLFGGLDPRGQIDRHHSGRGREAPTCIASTRTPARRTALTREKHAVLSYGGSAGGQHTVALISTPLAIGDLYLIGDAEPRRLTDVNGQLFSQLNLTAPEELWYTSFDGRRIQAWVQRPPDFR